MLTFYIYKRKKVLTTFCVMLIIETIDFIYFVVVVVVVVTLRDRN